MIPIDYRQTRKIRFTLRSDNILVTECVANTTMTLEDGRESTRISAEMVNFRSPRCWSI